MHYRKYNQLSFSLIAQVWQPDVWEVKMLLNQTSSEVTQEHNIYPARSSKIVAMPRENDIIMSEEYIAKTGWSFL